MARALGFDEVATAGETKEKKVIPAGDYIFQVTDYKERTLPADEARGIHTEYVEIELGLKVNCEGKDAWLNVYLKMIDEKAKRIRNFMEAVELVERSEEVRYGKIRDCKGRYGMANVVVSDDGQYNNVKFFRRLTPDEKASLGGKATVSTKKDDDDEEVPF